MPTPGEILPPNALDVGDLVQACDPSNIWYNARVIEKTGRGNSVAVKVRYIGFGPSHDETFTKAQHRVRARLPAALLQAERERFLWEGRQDGRTADGRWQVERILAVKRTKQGSAFLVRWDGWSATYDSWEPQAHLSPEAIEEFREEQQALAETRRNPPRDPPRPYTRDLIEAESNEVTATCSHMHSHAHMQERRDPARLLLMSSVRPVVSDSRMARRRHG